MSTIVSLMPQRRKRVLLLIDKPAARNPVVLMYCRTLRDLYDVTVACPDPVEAAARLDGVRLVPLLAPNVVLRLRALVRPLKNALFGRLQAAPPTIGSGGDASAAAPAARRRAAGARTRLQVGFVRTYVAESVSMFMHLRRLPRQDAVIAIDAEVLLTARLLASVWRARYAYFMYEIWPKQYNSFTPGESRARAVVERFGVAHAFASIVPDPRTGSLLVRRYGVPRSRVLAIATCPELPATAAAPRAAQPLAVYYHGTLHPGRGVENLVRAMAHVEGAVLSVRGIGPLLPVLERIVAEQGLGDRVRFLPALPVEQLAEAGTAFDVGVNVACPDNVNHRFSIGFKTFENLAAGLALVSTRSWVLGPFTQRHDVGLTFEGCSVAAIAEALRYCVAHPTEVARWKQRSRALAEREFNPSVQGAYLRELVAHLAASRGEVPSLALGERPV